MSLYVCIQLPFVCRLLQFYSVQNTILFRYAEKDFLISRWLPWFWVFGFLQSDLFDLFDLFDLSDLSDLSFSYYYTLGLLVRNRELVMFNMDSLIPKVYLHLLNTFPVEYTSRICIFDWYFVPRVSFYSMTVGAEESSCLIIWGLWAIHHHQLIYFRMSSIARSAHYNPSETLPSWPFS